VLVLVLVIVIVIEMDGMDVVDDVDEDD